ncbi:MAG TPA: YdcF family protein [Phycisphaerales bacterium]|mgnify:CR=1 FL=1|nr:YdcF family protein [Phycisphaerales bacterium]
MADLIKGLASPAVWVLVLMVAGLWRSRRLRRRKGLRCGWYAGLAATVLYVLLASEFVASLLCYSLESRCRPASEAELAGLDAMVVLSGGALPPWKHRPRAEPRWATLARVDGAVEAFRRSGAQVLVTSGGKTAGTQISAAEAMRDFAVRLGVSAERILVQGVSLTTAEDATETAKVLGPGPGRRIGVATSATHMQRSRRIFERVFPQDTIVPVPVDYQFVPPRLQARMFVPSAGAFHLSAMVLHEYVGRLWYCLRHGA